VQKGEKEAQRRKDDEDKRKYEEDRQAALARLIKPTKTRRNSMRALADIKAAKEKDEAEQKKMILLVRQGTTKPLQVSKSLLMPNKARLADQLELAMRAGEKRRQAAARSGNRSIISGNVGGGSSGGGSGSDSGSGGGGRRRSTYTAPKDSRLMRPTAAQLSSKQAWQRHLEEKAVAAELALLEAEEAEILRQTTLLCTSDLYSHVKPRVMDYACRDTVLVQEQKQVQVQEHVQEHVQEQGGEGAEGNDDDDEGSVQSSY
jgi:hypothetical protein